MANCSRSALIICSRFGIGFRLRMRHLQLCDELTHSMRCVRAQAACPLTLTFRRPLVAKPRSKPTTPASSRHGKGPQMVATNRVECWRVRSTCTAGVPLRRLPSTVASSVGRAEANSDLDALRRDGDWLQVRVRDVVAWANIDMLVRCPG
jgi:hypothetical protein